MVSRSFDEASAPLEIRAPESIRRASFPRALNACTFMIITLIPASDEYLHRLPHRSTDLLDKPPIRTIDPIAHCNKFGPA